MYLLELTLRCSDLTVEWEQALTFFALLPKQILKWNQFITRQTSQVCCGCVGYFLKFLWAWEEGLDSKMLDLSTHIRGMERAGL